MKVVWEVITVVTGFVLGLTLVAALSYKVVWYGECSGTWPYGTCQFLYWNPMLGHPKFEDNQ